MSKPKSPKSLRFSDSLESAPTVNAFRIRSIGEIEDMYMVEFLEYLGDQPRLVSRICVHTNFLSVFREKLGEMYEEVTPRILH